MIRQWRADWGRGDLPFLWVQLANFMAARSRRPADSDVGDAARVAVGGPGAAQRPARRWPSTSATPPTSTRATSRRWGAGSRWRRARWPTARSSCSPGPTYRSHEIKRRADRHRLRPRRRRPGGEGSLATARLARASRSPAPTAASSGPRPQSRATGWWCGSEHGPGAGRGPLRLGRQPGRRQPGQRRRVAGVAVPLDARGYKPLSAALTAVRRAGLCPRASRVMRCAHLERGGS